MLDHSSLESQTPGRLSNWQLVTDQVRLTSGIRASKYGGHGTEESPYVVTWIDNDPGNPMEFSTLEKWVLTVLVAIATLAISFASSAYTGGAKQVIEEFHCSTEVTVLGLALFVLGFAIGPLFWAPLSELYGRQVLFFSTYGLFTAFSAGAAGSNSIATLIVLRFWAGAFGSSPLTNSGGVIADMFPPSQRGLALSIFAVAPFLGPTLGPMIGGFVGMNVGWRWIEGVIAIFGGVVWIVGSLFIPETYGPVLLRRRAAALSKETGKIHRTQQDIATGPVTVGSAFKTALVRPWILLFREPIVFLLTIYLAIVYGTLYLMFGAFPIVYQQLRHWNDGVGGLPFLSLAIGMIVAVGYMVFENKNYNIAAAKAGGFAPPEARLPPAMVASVCLPVGLFWFAWTNGPNIHWFASVAAGVPFGFGMALVFLSVFNYLIDSYTIFAASVLAANSILRSLFGAAFPLFTNQMYARLGIHWASSIPAFLSLACLPFPFLFYKYGAAIRLKCKYAAEADQFMKSMRARQDTRAHQDEEIMEKSDEEERVLDNKELGESRAPLRKLRTGQSERSQWSEVYREVDLATNHIDRVTSRDSQKL
ncbi:MAG: hypothetical protein M1814_006379 [Vezdaea aestivalis]|nr:MAG: hypothetical protein M1814_006379 [Vezdaea aestivalis]